MNREEYSELMGYQGLATEEEFETANRIYMATGEMNKESFCADYKEHRESEIINELTNEVSRLDNLVKAQREEVREISEKIKKAGKTLASIADDVRNECLDEEAYLLEKTIGTLIGRTELLKIKIRKGYKLTDKDRDEIIAMLEQ